MAGGDGARPKTPDQNWSENERGAGRKDGGNVTKKKAEGKGEKWACLKNTAPVTRIWVREWLKKNNRQEKNNVARHRVRIPELDW